MKKILLTCFLELLCLFQKARKSIRSQLHPISMQYFHVGGWLISLRGTRSISHADRRVFCDQRECISSIIPDIRLKLIALCFLLFLGYSPLSMSQVADSPPAEDRASSAILRGGETRPDYSPFDIFGLVDSDQGRRAGEQVNVLEPAPVSVFSNQDFIHLELDGGPTAGSSGNPDPLISKSAYSDTLSLGDQLPSGLVLDQVLNSDSGMINLDDFAGKYVLLQFWAPSCSGSIASLSKIDRLLEAYQDEIELIPITTFPESEVRDLFKSYPSLDQLSRPMAVNALGMRALFPHKVIPHFVILDREGKVIAITGQSDINPKNLDLLIQFDESRFRHKVDKNISLDPGERLIAGSQQIPEKNIWFQSALTGYLPGINGSLIQNFEDFSHIRIVNMPLYKLYRLAYSERSLVDYYGLNRMETIGFGEEELFTDKSGADYIAWAEEGTHVFGYELIAPPSSDPYALMREDLRRFFPGIRASIQNRKQTVYALVQQDGKSYPESSSSERIYQVGATSASMRKYPLQGFVYHLNYYFYQSSPYPILNLTGIDYPIDMDLNAPLSNLEQLTEALQGVGLDLIKREEEIQILILEKTGKTNPPTL
jgi:Thiol-disulfide isomerase and thioredoxins